jgi:type IV secretory pathway ATPase VirB11/archaellum biosynthesis ATPase
MNASPRNLTVFLDRALAPIRTWLDDAQVVEICINGPGVVWVERLGQSAMERQEVPTLTESAIRHLAERVAGYSGQSINEEHPLLSAALPTGERFQGVMPPATSGGGAFSIRKQVIKDMRLADYRTLGSFDKVVTTTDGALSDVDQTLCAHLDAGRIEDFIRLAVVNRYSILLSGGTSSGKTTFLNAILKEVPVDERIITIEDTREVNPVQENFLALVASKGDQGEPIDRTEEEAASYDALKAEFEALNEQYDCADELPEEIDARLGELETAIAAFEDRPLRYAADDIARAGVFVCLGAEGRLEIERGYVRPEDEAPANKGSDAEVDGPAADADEDGSVQRADIAIGGERVEPEDDDDNAIRPLPDRLMTELTAHRTLALRDAIAGNPRVAVTALLHKLVRDAFDHRSATGCLEVTVRHVFFAVQADDLKDSASARANARLAAKACSERRTI